MCVPLVLLNVLLFFFQVPPNPTPTESVVEAPPAKSLKPSTMDQYLGTSDTKQGEFLRDIVLAFSSANIPLEKLKSEDGKTLLRQFMDKYVKVDGNAPAIPTPVNLQGTYLKKILTEGVSIKWNPLIPSFNSLRYQEIAKHGCQWQVFLCN